MKATWMEGCKKGNRAAQQEFYNYYAPRVLGVCRRYANGEEEAKDMFQEAFINIFNAMKKSDGIRYLDAWVRKVTANTAINYYKANKKHQGHMDTDEYASDRLGNEDYEHIIQRLSEMELIALIDQLPQGCRLVFNLHAIEGFNHKEIAKMMKINEGTSKSQLARAKSLLREKLNGLNDIDYAARTKQG